MEEYELRKVIEALTVHIQELTTELAAVLHDVSCYLPEDTRNEIRQMTAEDLNNSLNSDPYYSTYVETECDGINELTDELYKDEVENCLKDDDTDLFLPSYYSRKRLRKS